MDEKTDTVTTSPDGQVGQGTYIRPRARKLHDPVVTLEEYHFYAQKTRNEEQSLEAPKTQWAKFFSRKSGDNADSGHGHDPVKINTKANLTGQDAAFRISDEEWTNASRAFRTASAGAAFYLVGRPTCSKAYADVQITTDILGPFAVPFAIGTLGFGPGVALFSVFGFMAGYSGYLIWHVFLGVDSYGKRTAHLETYASLQPLEIVRGSDFLSRVPCQKLR